MTVASSTGGVRASLGPSPTSEDSDMDENRFQFVVHALGRLLAVDRRTSSLTTGAAPASELADPAASDWYETVVPSHRRPTAWHSRTPTLAATRLHGAVSHGALPGEAMPILAELVLAEDIRINPDIMQGATTPIRVGKFVFSRQTPAPATSSVPGDA
jgi:hypothetical protein